jgi:nucleoside-diphosphate-sugar epimerase
MEGRKRHVVQGGVRALTQGRRIFITGATGFIGRHLLDRLVQCGTHRITCLTRRSDVARNSTRRYENVEWITGDLGRPVTYSDFLSRADVVFHLAAATGAASAEKLRNVNEAGTEALIAAQRNGGAAKIVYVSSIAVTGRDLSDYPYAETKLAAEHAVLASGLECVIIRPTIVLGDGAPTWPALRTLACLPVVPLFGGGRAQVQPVDVIDVARGLEWLAHNSLESGSIVEIGGPEVLPFSAFLARIRDACGRRSFPHLSIPIAPVRTALRALTRVLGARSPVGPGQLAPFLNNGVARTNSVFERLRPDMLPLDELIHRVLIADRSR